MFAIGSLLHVSIRERVKSMRNKLGLTQDQLADRGEILRTEIVKIEGGKNLASTVDKRIGLARGFGLSLEDCNAYLDGEMSLDEALVAITKRAAAGLVQEVDPIPERASAVRFALEAGYPEEVIRKAYVARKGRTLSRDEWLDRLRGWRREYETGESDELIGEVVTREMLPAAPRARKRK